MTEYDLFVIGAGSGGVRASRMAASFGARVAVAEERYLGGTCVNVGCVPKKLFYYAAHYHEDFSDARGFGWQSTVPAFDWPTLRDNKTREIERLNGIYGNLLERAGVTIINGRARIIDAHTVAVGDKQYRCGRILIATGSWPWVPDFPGREHVITSNEVFYLEHFPKRMLVVGGGYIAVEFAGIFAGLGTETHIVHRSPHLLRGFDDEICRITGDEMQKKSVRLHFNTEVKRIDKQADGSLTAILNNGTGLTVDTVLYATGRKPFTTDLGLENVDVRLREDGSIIVNEDFQTTEPSIFALGDVNGGKELTPIALAEGMAFAKTQFNNTPTRVDYDNIPTAVFCQPNIGTVGLTEQEARERYGDIVIYTTTFTHLKHTLSGNNEKTFMKLIVDKQSDKVVGAHMVGLEAGEIIQGIAIAIKAGATKAVFDGTIGIHPTAAEEFVTMREATR